MTVQAGDCECGWREAADQVSCWRPSRRLGLQERRRKLNETTINATAAVGDHRLTWKVFGVLMAGALVGSWAVT